MIGTSGSRHFEAKELLFFKYWNIVLCDGEYIMQYQNIKKFRSVYSNSYPSYDENVIYIYSLWLYSNYFFNICAKFWDNLTIIVAFETYLLFFHIGNRKVICVMLFVGGGFNPCRSSTKNVRSNCVTQIH